MKKLLTMVLAALMLFSFTACGEDEDSAQGGFTFPETEIATKAPEIMVTEPTTTAATEPETEAVLEEETEPVNLAGTYINYCGKWKSTEHFHYIELYIEDQVMYLDYACMSGNGARIAQTLASVPLTEIQDGKATFTYSDDGWGNQGMLSVVFTDTETIECEAVTTYQNPGANWSILPGTHTFERNA